MKRNSLHGVMAALVALMMVGSFARAEDWPCWRGPNHDGISTEKGLLKTWPKDGPKKVWSLPGLGAGYSSVAVVGDTIYATGGKGGQGVLYAISKDGKIKWEQAYGKEGGGGGYGGSRSTPTVDNGLIYVISSLGTLSCHDAKDGKQKWTVDARAKYGMRLPQWEQAESPLTDEKCVYMITGGTNATVVAFDKKTGKEVWASESTGAKSAYCSPVLVEYKKKPVLLGMVESGLIGVDPKKGKILFQHPHKNRWAVHANTPIFSNDMIYITSGYNYGGGMLTMGKNKVDEKWTSKDLCVQHGGAILFDGCVIAAGDGGWAAIDLKSGKTKWKDQLIGKGSCVVADGLFYGYSERGTVGLIKADKNGGKVISSFKITEGEKQHWAHPVVSGGRLYIRHGSVLMSFDVKK